ncbi:hypothetical protein [Paraburkholderia youngii]|uniref:Uncharacterized protein n=1 Tax=Paraburkholderia youngii TaxID=2782701 RepID=A0A7Y6JUQ5_9BURK|nr:hypothetical protein [Paraburkholderia youngii]NUX98753.1 hypothetical protein [Paraburkholderia youngii]
MKVHNSYSSVMFDPAKLRKVVAELARKLPELQEKFDFDTIAVTGKSGCAVGFALSMVTGIHVVYVRKGESSHGDMVEGDGHEFTRYAFFDDFVCSGSTRDRIEEELKVRCNARGVDVPTCVLTIEYQTSNSQSRLTGAKTFCVADADKLPAHSFAVQSTEEFA